MGPQPGPIAPWVAELRAERDRLREALERIDDFPYRDAEDAADVRQIARKALSRPEDERG